MKRVVVIVVVLPFLLGTASAEDPVFFEDEKLEVAVEEALWVSDPTPADMLMLTYLYVGDVRISSLRGLEYALNLETLRVPCNDLDDISPVSSLSNLRTLVVNNNWIRDLSPMAGLSNLSHFDAHDNHYISDLSPLASLYGLTTLILRGNQISNVGPLSSLVNLRDVVLRNNQISDVSPLLGLTCLRHLDLTQNPLSDEVYDVQIPQIIEDNPGIDIHYTGITCTVSLSSSEGGSVIEPGEGEFTYQRVNSLRIEAKADPGYVFSAWTGTCYTTQNPTVIPLDMNYRVCAVFLRAMTEVHVDDDAPYDPKHDNPDVSDPLEDGTADHPFDSIQEAVEVAMEGATVIVLPGIYRENITIPGKSIHLMGRDPNDPVGTALPVIHAAKSGSVVTIIGVSGSHSTITGFAVEGGDGQGGAIRCSDAVATISHCLIAGNRPTGSPLIECTNSNAAFTNCTISDNYLDTCSGGLRALNSTVRLTNSIVYGNTYGCSGTTGGHIFADDSGDVSITFSDVEGGRPGTGNIDEDPLFVRRGQWADPQNPLIPRDPSDSSAVWLMGDYHVQSEAGRWDPAAGLWVYDAVSSPCVDAGDPAREVGHEPSPNGGIINMGIYGGTTEAGKSY